MGVRFDGGKTEDEKLLITRESGKTRTQKLPREQ